MDVPFFSGEYTVADVAYSAIREIIIDIPTFKLLGIRFNKVCGYCSYWEYVRESEKNREKFQKAVRKWYEKNKDNLKWVDEPFAVTDICTSPAGGHYYLKNDKLDEKR